MVSIVVLTMNEAADLPICLQSIAWCNDVHILDSGSTDATVSIAQQFNAAVTVNGFESFGKQRNFALENLHLKNDWVLFLDADEVATDDFFLSLKHAISNAGQDVAGFYCCWKMMLNGRWLKRADNFPKWQFRLLHKDRARFTDFGHGQKEGEIIGKINYISEPYLHFGFSKGWFHWLERHNRYSDLEAKARLTDIPVFKNIFSRTQSIRNPALKSWLSKIPGWPVLRFFQAYFLNRGFMDGSPGLVYCINMSYYEFLIQLKMKEIKSKKIILNH